MEQTVRLFGANTGTLAGAIRAGGGAVANFWNFVHHLGEVSRQRRQLQNLDARLLDDIGIDRMQALKESNRPAWDF